MDPALQGLFITPQAQVDVFATDFTDIAAAVVRHAEAGRVLEALAHRGFAVPLFVTVEPGEALGEALLPRVAGVIQLGHGGRHYHGRQIADAAERYADGLLPPFFRTLRDYVRRGHVEFDCPGHQGGQFFSNHPLGRMFFDFYGETLFRSDLCNADVKLGDLLIHEGPALQAQKNAARIYNADKSYFVLNGTSTSNKVVLNALLAPGDLVLFDRNNHKSVHLGALVLAGAQPVYLETARNAWGFIGGIDAQAFDEAAIRAAIREVAPERADAPRPFRVAVIQLGTYDGTIYNARQVVDRIGRLCDYILFDSAWVGYEQFIPMMRDCSPLLLELGPEDPGLFVTQSVHKQQAGFSQSSQIHKKDRHIKGQQRYCNHKRFNNAFMMHASTSPFYPMFAALDVNAQIHDGPAGRRLWRDCVRNGVEARKLLLKSCRHIAPFIPRQVDGRPWAEHPTEQIVDELRFFRFQPGESWHGFEGYAENQYFVDPCKLLLTTPGIARDTHEYEPFGAPAAVLAHFLREQGVIPEKSDLYSILFLLTPSESFGKLQSLIARLVQFEHHLENDSPLREVLPSLCVAHPQVYEGLRLRQLCQRMHDFYREHDIKRRQKEMFRRQHLPRRAMTPQAANAALVRNEVELVPLSAIEGRIAAEGALPYPPGVLCVVPGEVWGGPALRYFRTLEAGINALPGFEPELQGVYVRAEADGLRRAYGYVLKKG
ncbi:ornithine decarboxylase [Roseateles sp. DAIF2]|nr:ornithine decarboxylase [Roseateles sp. DAIF2]